MRRTRTPTNARRDHFRRPRQKLADRVGGWIYVDQLGLGPFEALKTADGDPIEGRKKHSAGADGKQPPVGFIDLTLSAPKSLSVAWALASVNTSCLRAAVCANSAFIFSAFASPRAIC